MNVSLTRELEDFVKQKVDQRMYPSAGEVVREALPVISRARCLKRDET